jgi:spore coat polysaccharide biosynthesis protein SpsF (cytidylyltransferase family)
MKVGIVIQARFTSKRLPGKIEKEIGGESLLNRVLDYCYESNADGVVLAVPSDQTERFEKYVHGVEGVKVFGGDEEKVALRYVTAGEKYGFDYLIRITSDDPFKPTPVINAIIELCRLDVYDYISNNVETIMPEGFDIEAFKKSALLESLVADDSEFNYEHVTPNLRSSSDYKKLWFASSEDYSEMRCTVDVQEDLDVCNDLINSQGGKSFKDIIDFFSKNKKKLDKYLRTNRSEYYGKNK